MELRRHELDGLAFILALAALSAVTLAFLSARNGGAVIMCGICLGALVVGRLAGVPGLVLLPAALGFAALVWIVWVDPPSSPRRTSALAHAVGGALVGWALFSVLRRRRWPLPWLAAIAGVFALAVCWEIGEYMGDRLLDTALIPSKRDSALDIFFGTFGGVVGVAFGSLVTQLLQDQPDSR